MKDFIGLGIWKKKKKKSLTSPVSSECPYKLQPKRPIFWVWAGAHWSAKTEIALVNWANPQFDSTTLRLSNIHSVFIESIKLLGSPRVTNRLAANLVIIPAHDQGPLFVWIFFFPSLSPRITYNLKWVCTLIEFLQFFFPFCWRNIRVCLLVKRFFRINNNNFLT